MKISNKERILIKRALDEDIGRGDITTKHLNISNKKAEAIIMAKENCILCGIDIAKEVFNILGNSKFKKIHSDGEKIKKSKIVAKVLAPAKVILTGERTALNFLMHLSGISTITRKIVDISSKFGIKIYDTRKTLPGLRTFEKYAVEIGGGNNHRMGLYDGILIKENHIEFCRKIYNKNAIPKALEFIKSAFLKKKITIEVKNFNEFKQALSHGADIIMLDNWKKKNILKTLEYKDKNCEIEISGNISIENIHDYLIPGIDRISIGMITHSVKAVDFSLYIV
jgi:nicotinate-nucleotide pyrophosphorylase (carboxylating)